MKDFVVSFTTVEGLNYFNVIVPAKNMGSVATELRDMEFNLHHVTYCAQLTPAS